MATGLLFKSLVVTVIIDGREEVMDWTPPAPAPVEKLSIRNGIVEVEPSPDGIRRRVPCGCREFTIRYRQHADERTNCFPPPPARRPLEFEED